MIGDIWDWIFATTTAAGTWSLIAFLLLGGAVAAFPYSWYRTALLATWIHEAGHAVAAMLTGRSVSKIRLEKDRSGVTNSVGKATGFGKFITTFAGYPAPSITGGLIILAVTHSHTQLAIAGLALVTLALLPFQHSLRGLTVSLVLAILIATMWWFSSTQPLVTQGILMLLAGYFLMASPRNIWELHQARKQQKEAKVATGEDQHSDADSLARDTGIPAIVWEAIFLITTAAITFFAVKGIFAP